MTSRPKTGNYVKPVSESFGELMTVEEYLETVDQGNFIDYDGFGVAVKDNMQDLRNTNGFPPESWIKPSHRETNIPLDATHIMWFNR